MSQEYLKKNSKKRCQKENHLNKFFKGNLNSQHKKSHKSERNSIRFKFEYHFFTKNNRVNLKRYRKSLR